MTTRRLTLALAALATLHVMPAFADYPIKNGDNVRQIIKAGTVSGNILPYMTPVDSSGAPYNGANPFAITFGSGVKLPDFTNPQHFICDSGCGGGGGSGYTVTFNQAIGTLGTPTGFKDVSGNFQALLGDTTNGQWVNVKASVPLAVTGTFWQTTQPVSIASPVAVTGPLTDAQLRNSAVPVSLSSTTITGSVAVTGTFFQATQPISAAALPLPALAATSTKQSDGTQKTQIVDGSGNVIASTANAMNVNCANCGGGGGGGTSSNFGDAFPIPGTAVGMSQGGLMVALNGIGGLLNVTGAGGTFPVTGTFWQATQPVSIAGTVTVTGALTDAQLRASAVPVSLTSTTITGTVAVTQSGAWSLSANQSVNISQINGVTPLTGNGVTGTGSQRVTIASDNTAFTVNLGTIGGTATAANQATVLTNLGAPGDAVCATATGSCSLIALAKYNNQQIVGPIPVNVNATATGLTGLTPGVAQTGTIIAANIDLSSVAGTALGATANYGTAPSAVRALSANVAITNLGTTAVSVNSGNKDAGTQRSTLATDQLALASWGHGATGAAPPAGATQMGAAGSGATGGLMAGVKTCDLHATYDASDNGSKEVIAAVLGRTIYICGYVLATGSTATNLKLVDGTGTDCGTGTPINLIPAWQLLANDKIGANSAFWNGLKATGTNRAVCVNASAGNAHQAEIWYTIQ